MQASLSDRWRSFAARISGSVGHDQIVLLQLLRGVAASGVVVEHLLERYARRGAIPGDLPDVTARLGQTGVFTFFAISGFIMVYITARDDARTMSGAAFFKSRVLRVAPLYYLTTLLMMAFAWFTQSLSTRGAWPLPSVTDFIMSFLFIPHRGVNGLIQPVYVLGWTLHYEMFFYLLFAIGLAMGVRRGTAFVLLVLGALVVAGAWIPAPAERWGLAVIAYVFTRPVMLYFAVGIVLALVRQRIAKRLPRVSVPVVLIVVGVALTIAAAGHGRAITLAAIAVALGMVVLTEPATAHGPLGALARAFGDASYSIYLTHSFLLGAFAAATGMIAARSGALLATCVAVACLICFAAGWLTWRFVERPLTDRLRRKRSARAELVAP